VSVVSEVDSDPVKGVGRGGGKRFSELGVVSEVDSDPVKWVWCGWWKTI